MTQKKTRPKILLALPLAFQNGIDVYSGIMRFLRKKRLSWDIQLDRLTVSANLLNATEQETFDGAIIDRSAPLDSVLTHVTLKTPLVLLDRSLPPSQSRSRLVHIDSDSRQIGRTAARTLMKTSNFASYAYLPPAHNTTWSSGREKAFSRELARRGIQSVILRPLHPLEKQLLELPKPAAVFAANDTIATKALAACQQMGISVPEDLSVLGVDNELLTCRHSDPPLASIQPDFEKAGYMSAASLAALLAHKPVKPHQHYGIVGVTPRQSMEPSGTSGKLVQRAIELIRDTQIEIGDINNLAKTLGVSRRLLDLRFREIRSQSVHDAIINIRMENICNLLKTTNMSIAEICTISHLGSGTNPLRAFRKHFGMTMGDYRRTQRSD